jgi:hypothetical protein
MKLTRKSLTYTLVDHAGNLHRVRVPIEWSPKEVREKYEGMESVFMQIPNGLALETDNGYLKGRRAAMVLLSDHESNVLRTVSRMPETYEDVVELRKEAGVSK